MRRRLPATDSDHVVAACAMAGVAGCWRMHWQASDTIVGGLGAVEVW